MFDLITKSMIFLLDSLYTILQNYGLAIIVLTLAIRGILWPFSKAQTKSMQAMQVLQPKMKQIQERFKTDPQKLQQEMAKLYKEHKFNPLGGCLPILVQIPLFIGLFWAISSPHFMAGQEPIFMDFIHLKRAGIISHAGLSDDGKMTLQKSNEGLFFGIGKDHLIAQDKIILELKNGKTVDDRKVENAATVFQVLPKEPIPGEPLKVNATYEGLGLDGYQGNIKRVTLNLLNSGSKENESVVLLPSADGKTFNGEMKTVEGKMSLNLDVLLLVALFVASMWLFQKQMNQNKQADANPQQAQMMKMMQIVFIGFLFVFPLPAGVLLYMVTNSVFQNFQTWWFSRNAEPRAAAASNSVVDITAATKS